LHHEKYIPDAGKVKAKRTKKAGKGENEPENDFFRHDYKRFFET